MNFKNWCKQNLPRALLALFLLFITQAFSTLETYITNPQLNAVLSGNWRGFLLFTLLAFLASLALNFSFNWSNYLFTKQTQDFYGKSRQKIVKHFYNHRKKSVSEMQNILSNDLEIVEKNYFTSYFYFLCNLGNIVLIIGTLFTFSWILVVFTVVVGVISVLIPQLMGKYTSKATEKVSQQNNKFLNTIEKWVIGLSQLRRYNGLLPFKQFIGKASKKLENSEINQVKSLTIATLVQGVVDIIGRVGVPLLAGILYFNDQIQFGAIVTAGLFAENIFGSFWSLNSRTNQIKSTKQLRNKIDKLMNNMTSADKDTPISKIASIEGHKLSKKFNSGETIYYPDFKINLGEKILLTGDSGSGKSTLLELILGLEKPTSGEIIFKDKNNNVIQPNLGQIGYLAQDLVLFSATIRQNMTMFNPALDKKALAESRKVDLRSDLDNFKAGIDSLIDPEHNTLSGGQKQKIILARNFIHQKPVVLFDEATSAIDEKSTSNVLKVIVSQTPLAIVIAHNLNTEQKRLFDREIHLTKEVAQ